MNLPEIQTPFGPCSVYLFPDNIYFSFEKFNVNGLHIRGSMRYDIAPVRQGHVSLDRHWNYLGKKPADVSSAARKKIHDCFMRMIPILANKENVCKAKAESNASEISRNESKIAELKMEITRLENRNAELSA